jgi:pSer/pThr/pTyr-binding forkhead associated (FHA) protein
VLILPTGAQMPVTKDRFLIGRSAACDLRLAETAISRRHALLRFSDGAWYLQDQGSAAGTFVNGVRQAAARLQPGDRITIGSTTFVFQCNAALIFGKETGL